jgi:hypothetical protein
MTLSFKEQVKHEKDFFKCGNLCNNNKLETFNHEIFQRVYTVPVKTRLELRNQPNENRISEQAQVIDDESELYTLNINNSRCPTKKYQMQHKTNPDLSNNINYYGAENMNLVGIHNKLPDTKSKCTSSNSIHNEHSQNRKHNNIDTYSNTLNVCSKSSLWKPCLQGSYLRGSNPAAAQTDVRYGKLVNDNSKNYWLNYMDISNTSSGTLYNHQKIGNRMTHYTTEQSLPFMLEDVRVRKIPDNKVSCTDMFNNMTRRKCLFETLS